MAIISAGVIMNVIFAFIFATIAYGLGVPIIPSIVSRVRARLAPPIKPTSALETRSFAIGETQESFVQPAHAERDARRSGKWHPVSSPPCRNGRSRAN